jgi:hypothetical protein
MSTSRTAEDAEPSSWPAEFQLLNCFSCLVQSVMESDAAKAERCSQAIAKRWGFRITAPESWLPRGGQVKDRGDQST